MSTYTIHLEPEVDDNAIARVRSTLPRVGKDDQLMIVMEAADAHQAGRVMEILEAHGFDYQPRGSHGGRDYHIIAARKK